ncbi:dihydrodipicolinate synthase family protein [Actinopolymorpha alba]|uniref:dihydrodipicolinate synthase family protein n=1 Tax=Actinopolymorpha alba TaxID=533267 RepID=UPI0003782D17|nr:dihydrodipicolinate synthase family protein [Actinopolymorpha alba]
MNHAAFDGVTIVLVTPYRNHTTSVNEDVATEIAARADRAGIHALTALGNTAEVQQLDIDERRSTLRAVALGRTDALLVAGVAGSLGTLLADAEFARDLGYDSVMVHEPADPFGDGSGLVAYYEQVADRAPLPVVLYLRSTRVKGHDLARLVAHPNIVAVKYAREDLFTLATLLNDASAAHCVWINGLAESRVPAFASLGVRGFTSGIANVRPEAALAVHAAARRGDLNGLGELLRDAIGPIEAIRAEDNGRFNVAVLKELLRWHGVEAGDVRAPHSPLTDSARARLRKAAASWAEAASA